MQQRFLTNRLVRLLGLLLVVQLLVASVGLAWAAPATVDKVRVNQSIDRVRIVLDMGSIPAYTAVLEKEPLRLVVDMPAQLSKKVMPQLTLNDPFISTVVWQETGPGQLRLIVNLRMMVTQRIFSLSSPNRLVIDLTKNAEQKRTEDIRSGLTYTSWSRGGPAGPVQAYILTIEPKAGLMLRPELSNGAVAGLATVGAMSAEAKAIAAVNGSYFAPNGEIIGLLKLDGKIVSTPTLARSAVGFFPDGKIAIDQVSYEGKATLPGGKTVEIAGVNRERGADEAILYTDDFGPATGTNTYGIDYVLNDKGLVIGVIPGNAPLTGGNTVLSVHGEAAKELAGLKLGDQVKISQSLGPVWDKAVHALGAGPTLVRDGNVYLTTKSEEFGSDVAGGRAPRTALGLTKDGKILLVVVDGRQAHSAGMTLLELALFMEELGAVDALNLDGGGSSEMVVQGKVRNVPSDGRERKVGDALILLPTKLAN